MRGIGASSTLSFFVAVGAKIFFNAPYQHLARKASPAIAGFVAMMTSRARLRHGTPFGADALFSEDIHPFFRTVQPDQGHACPTLLVRCC